MIVRKDIDIRQGDCLELMKEIPDGSIDMILCDLPYQVTACEWDIMIPFDALWNQYKRICKKNSAICLFGTEPFSSMLRMSNLKDFKYDWIWSKTIASNFMMSKHIPNKLHEIISVFYQFPPTYNPQMRFGEPYKDKARKRTIGIYSKTESTKIPIDNDGVRYPSTVLHFSNGNNGNVHPTQKPVDLLEYLIRTYTNDGELVLDNCFGSGSTAIACLNTGRRFIGMELNQEYFDIAKKRIEEHFVPKRLF